METRTNGDKREEGAMRGKRAAAARKPPYVASTSGG